MRNLFPLALLFYSLLTSNILGAELRIAAASSLRRPLEAVAKQFQKEHPGNIGITYGASGALYAQLIHGAPFDIFLSADEEPVHRLIEQGLAESLFDLGQGRLVLWAPHASRNINKIGIEGLLDPSIKRIAIAHPTHASYGKAAIAVLKHFGIYTKIQDKLIFGEDVSQAAHFVTSGAADAGVLAYSILDHPIQGVWVIPHDAYGPLKQLGVRLINDHGSAFKDDAQAFITFITTEPRKSLFQSWMAP